MSPTNNINNKDKQGAAGNWGKPNKFEKKNTKICYAQDTSKHRGKAKYKKKEKKEYFYDREICPFCRTPLKKIERKQDSLSIWPYTYATTCDNCGAEQVDEECPACKCTYYIWKDKNNVYTHQSVGCGFVGKRKY